MKPQIITSPHSVLEINDMAQKRLEERREKTSEYEKWLFGGTRVSAVERARAANGKKKPASYWMM